MPRTSPSLIARVSGQSSRRTQARRWQSTPYKGAVRLHYTRLYTGPDGETHFEDVDMKTSVRTLTDKVPPLTLSELFLGTGVFFMHTQVTAEFQDPEFHISPQKMMIIQLTGTSIQECSDGTVRVFHPGDVALLEDTTGKGHRSRHIGDAISVAMIPLAQCGDDE